MNFQITNTRRVIGLTAALTANQRTIPVTEREPVRTPSPGSAESVIAPANEFPPALLQQVTDTLASLQFQIDDWQQGRQKNLADLQQLTVLLAVEVARSVLLRDLEHEVARIEGLVQTALGMLDQPGDLVVRIHPKIHEALVHQHAELLQQPSLKLVADAKIKLGDCQVDTPNYSLVSNIDDQLTQIRNKLLEGLSDAQIERRQTGPGHSGLQRFPDRRYLA